MIEVKRYDTDRGGENFEIERDGAFVTGNMNRREAKELLYALSQALGETTHTSIVSGNAVVGQQIGHIGSMHTHVSRNGQFMARDVLGDEFRTEDW